jgi:glycine C-acetyltransferase
MHSLDDVEETIIAFSAMREKLESGVYKKIGATMV